MTQCATAFSQHPVIAAAVGEVVGGLLDQIDPHPDLAVLIAAGPHAAELEQLTAAASTLLVPEIMVAAGATAVFGGALDERAPSGIAAMALHSKDLAPLRIGPDDSSAGATMGYGDDDGSTLLLLGAPGFPASRCLGELAARPAAVAIVGACGPAAQDPSGPQLILDGLGYTDGAIGVLFGPGLATVHELGVALPDPDGGPPPIGPLGMSDPAGLMLFADPGVDMVGGPTLDFDLVFERFGSRLSGMVGGTIVHPPGGGFPPFGPRAAALVIERAL